MNVHGRDLHYFSAVAEELSFTRAAERLFVSQPALSKQIRMLEKQLGVALFERDRRTVRLTAVGEALVPHARAVLTAWQAAEAAVEEAKSAERRTLVIGMSTSPGRGLLPALRTRLVSRHPDARPVLRQVNWADPSAGLADGSSDVAFVWLPLPDDDRYQYAVVAREPRLVALPDGHPLVARAASDPEGKVDFTDLLDEPFLALPRRPVRCGTTGSPWTPGTVARRGSAGWWPAPRRPTRRSPAAREWRCWPPVTPRWSSGTA